ncbi:MAG: hypothetical protein SGCHY_004673 [Lobulomycetales sp.]
MLLSLSDAVIRGDIDTVRENMGKVDINRPNRENWVPLHAAVNYNFLEIAKMLLDRRCDINKRDNQGWTALHYAAFKSRKHMVELLLHRKAKPLKSLVGQYPIDVARNIDIRRMLETQLPVLPASSTAPRKRMAVVKANLPERVQVVTGASIKVGEGRGEEKTDKKRAAPVRRKPEARFPTGTLDPAIKNQPVYHDLQLLAEIGRGGCGVVYKARYLGNVVAAKQIAATFTKANKISLLELVVREAKTLISQRHPRIVEYIDFHTQSFSILLEYLPMGSLGEYIRKTPSMVWKDRYTVMLDVAEGMDFLHSKSHNGKPKQDVFHQDLKSMNVLLSRSGKLGNLRAKLGDFGLSVIRDHVTAKRDAPDSQESQGGLANSVCLANGHTPGYQAPEQATNPSRFTKACDVWAFGVILLELVTLNPPEKGLVEKYWSSGILPLNELPFGITSCLTHSLYNDPVDRWGFGRLRATLKSDESVITKFAMSPENVFNKAKA